MFDRRSLLKIFGLGAAVVPAIGKDGTTFETIMDPNPVPPPGERRLEAVRKMQESGYYSHYDVVHDYLYSALEVGRRREPQGSNLIAPNGGRLDARVIDARSEYMLFDYAVGDDTGALGGRMALPADTNMYTAGWLDAPETYAVSRIGILFSPATRPEVRASFAERYTVEFWMGKKRFWNSPIAAVFGVGEIETLDGAINQTRSPAIGWVTLEIPLLIPDQMSFFVRLVGTPDADDELKLWAVLGNLHARGVQ